MVGISEANHRPHIRPPIVLPSIERPVRFWAHTGSRYGKNLLLWENIYYLIQLLLTAFTNEISRSCKWLTMILMPKWKYNVGSKMLTYSKEHIDQENIFYMHTINYCFHSERCYTQLRSILSWRYWYTHRTIHHEVQVSGIPYTSSVCTYTEYKVVMK